MAISWEQWEAMHSSLDYSSGRILELVETGDPDVRAELDALIHHALGVANRLVDLAGPCTPDLSTAKSRLRWDEGRKEAMAIRERIVEHEAAWAAGPAFAPVSD